MNNELKTILDQFQLEGTPVEAKPLGNGLINDTYKVITAETDAPDYVLQRINNAIFTDVDLLQDNVTKVTRHIRQKLMERAARCWNMCRPHRERPTFRPQTESTGA